MKNSGILFIKRMRSYFQVTNTSDNDVLNINDGQENYPDREQGHH